MSMETEVCCKASLNEYEIWLAESLSDIPELYWIEEKIALPADLDGDRFKRALELVFKRHQSLHQYFVEIDGELYKKVSRNLELPLFSISPGPLSLFVPPLIQFIWNKASTLIIKAHHIIFDAGSLILLFKELNTCYRDPLSVLPQVEYGLKNQDKFPLQYGNITIPKLQLPVKNSPYSDRACTIFFTFAKDDLKKKAQVQRISVSTYLLGIFLEEIRKITGQKECAVAIPRIGLGSFFKIGMLVETFVCVVQMDNDWRENLNKLYLNCIPLSKCPPRSVSILYNYLDLGLAFGRVLPKENFPALFDLRFEVREIDGTLEGYLIYRESMFDQMIMETIRDGILKNA